MTDFIMNISSMSPVEAKENFDGLNFIILDVREKNEFEYVNIPNSLHVPMMTLSNSIEQIPKDKDIGVL
ncbi:MAG: rhodanese-like domain-containing protein, partial [Candidatus Hodarchaeales archaeon]